MKKLLLLGAMQMHVPIIRRAKERGIYVITCDYIPENEGHKLADKAYFDSTTDLPAVLRIAQEEQVDGVMTFNSDPAALTAAYVADKLDLPGSGYEAVKLLSEIGLFRFPIMLKPVDSSGSKGVVRIDSPVLVADCFSAALAYSRCKRIIVEEFITPQGSQMHGDAFVKDGKVEFIYLGDHHFDSSINNLLPVSTTFPSLHPEEDIRRVESEVQRFITAVGFRQGGINIEARISASDKKVYLIEAGPRNGGNFTPIVIQYASGFNFMDACLEAALGLPFTQQHPEKEGCYAYLILHSREDGVLSEVGLSPELEEKVLRRYDYLQPGDPVKSFRGANAAVGVLLARFSSLREMQHYADHIDKYSTVKLI